MSDCFDHMADAFDSYDRSQDEGFINRKTHRNLNVFERDPLFYHRKIEFLKIEHETEKAYLLKISEQKGVWVPKSICKKKTKNSMYVHTATFEKCTWVKFS